MFLLTYLYIYIYSCWGYCYVEDVARCCCRFNTALDVKIKKRDPQIGPGFFGELGHLRIHRNIGILPTRNSISFRENSMK